MLMGDALQDDGTRYRYTDIVAWCSERGLHVSTGALSRHRNRHLGPALEMALEAQSLVDAISKATGKPLSLHTAVVNVVAAKLLRQLEHVDLTDADPVRLMQAASRAAEVAGKLARTEQTLTPQTVEQVEAKLRQRGLEPDVIAQIKADLYGLE
jgi:hypothetical protein